LPDEIDFSTSENMMQLQNKKIALHDTNPRSRNHNRILSPLTLFKISGKKFPNLQFVVKKNFNQEYLYLRMFKSYVFFLFEFMNPQTTHTYIYIKMYML